MAKKAAQAIPNYLLRAARQERGWTQKDVANRIGAPLDLNVTRWERGTAKPSAYYVQKLCELFGKSPRELGLLPWQQETNSQRELEAERERPWNVPFGRNPFFTGRGQLLERLHAQLFHNQRAALTQSAALSGLGGIGKTQAAIEYAYRYRDEYTAVFWVRANSRETLMADYVAIARLLLLPGSDTEDQMQVVTTVKRWLREHESWLLMLDNADDLSLVPDFLPREGKGHLVLTTRAQATGKLARSLPVEKMEPSESMQLLLHRAKLLERDEPLDTVSAAERRAAQQLVEELDGLPLALDQAGAYIEETECSLADYLALYSQRRLALLKRESSMESDYPHSVASTWELSFSQVEQADPAAADLLRLCAFLHPDAIPEAILTEGADQLGPRLRAVAADPLRLNDAIQLLRRYSLVKRDPQAKLLTVHRLVQVVLKESLDTAIQQQWAERAVRAVNAAFPHEEYASWERSELCLSHALLGAELIEQNGFSFPEATRLLHATGLYLGRRRRYAQAQLLLERALSLRQHTLGAEHPDTASTLNRLADLYMISGNYQQAELLVQPALATYERVLGPAHPEVAYALNTLASVYMFTARYVQAEPLYLRSLALREQALGPTHPFVAETLNGLAVLYVYQGKYAQAEPLLQQALSVAERVLGEENPDTLYSLLHLGRLSTLQGQYQQAEALLQRAHILSERVLGPEHDMTLRTLLLLAQLSHAQHRNAQAESLYQKALTGFEHVLGPGHPRVAETLTGLAQLSIRQRHYAQAESLLQRALTIDEHALGPEHPQTAAALDAQGHLALLEGREEQAALLLQRALALREQALGNNHPDVAHTLHHLAQLYEKQGKLEQAHSLYQQALSILEHALDPDHPDTTSVLKDYTALLRVMK